MKCGFKGCEKEAIEEVTTSNGRMYPACSEHLIYFNPHVLFVSKSLISFKSTPNVEIKNPIPGVRNVTRNHNFGDWSDEKIEEYLINHEKFIKVRKLEDGSWVGIMLLLKTTSVCCDIGPSTQFAYRWCFKDPVEAEEFFNEVKEFDDPPENKSSLVGHRFTGYSRLYKTDQEGFKRW